MRCEPIAKRNGKILNNEKNGTDNLSRIGHPEEFNLAFTMSAGRMPA